MVVSWYEDEVGKEGRGFVMAYRCYGQRGSLVYYVGNEEFFNLITDRQI